VEHDDDIPLPRFFKDDDLDEWAAQWTDSIDALENLEPRPYRIRYESLQENRPRVLADLFAHMKLPSDGEIIGKCVSESSFQKMSGGRNAGETVATAKARKGVSGDWRNYFTRRDAERFHELAGSELIALKYENDDSWCASMPESLVDNQNQ
jgi:Sulfotransferase domain